MIDFRKMWLTGLHKAGVGPSHQTAEKVKPRKLPDTDAAVGGLQPKSEICDIPRPNDLSLALR